MNKAEKKELDMIAKTQWRIHSVFDICSFEQALENSIQCERYHYAKELKWCLWIAHRMSVSLVEYAQAYVLYSPPVILIFLKAPKRSWSEVWNIGVLYEHYKHEKYPAMIFSMIRLTRKLLFSFINAQLMTKIISRVSFIVKFFDSAGLIDEK